MLSLKSLHQLHFYKIELSNCSLIRVHHKTNIEENNQSISPSDKHLLYKFINPYVQIRMQAHCQFTFPTLLHSPVRLLHKLYEIRNYCSRNEYSSSHWLNNAPTVLSGTKHYVHWAGLELGAWWAAEAIYEIIQLWHLSLSHCLSFSNTFLSIIGNNTCIVILVHVSVGAWISFDFEDCHGQF